MSKQAFSYQDIYLQPNFSSLHSRGEANVKVTLCNRTFNAPWIPANMESVINEDIAKWLSENDYFYIMHRFGDTRKFIQRARAEAWKLVSISVGVKQDDKDLILDIASSKCRVHFITIDIAHGHSILVREMIQFIRDVLPDVKIIAGNVCTREAVGDLEEWGADVAKVGIAGGHACSTKNMTGFHVPMFSCVKDICKEQTLEIFAKEGNVAHSVIRIKGAEIPIIADGGIRENGDIPKALVAGATMVMAGSIFAACVDAPGENVYENVPTNPEHWSKPNLAPSFERKFTKKRYHGSASAKQKGEKKHVEGFELEIPCNGMTYCEKYQELTESLKSAVSYAGGDNLSAFKKVQYITIK